MKWEISGYVCRVFIVLAIVAAVILVLMIFGVKPDLFNVYVLLIATFAAAWLFSLGGANYFDSIGKKSQYAHFTDRTTLVLSGLTLASCILGITTCVNNDNWRHAMIDAFKETLNTEGEVAPTVEYNGNAKVVACYYNRGWKDTYGDWSNDIIPSALHAQSPEDVELIVYVRCSKNRVATYTNLAAGYTYTYDVKIVNPWNWGVYASRGWVGSSPPDYSKGGDTYGSRPDEASIRQWVENQLEEIMQF